MTDLREAPATLSVGSPSTPSRAPVLALLGVVVLFAVAVVAMAPLSRIYLYPDEATYLSQVAPGRSASPFAVHRARGMPVLLAPVAVFVGDNMVLLRTWLLLLHVVGAFVAFRPWVRLVGWIAPVGAVLFLGSWVTVLFGAQAYPNLPVALTAVGASGQLAAYLRRPRSVHLVAMAAWIALMALLRPLDSVLVAGSLWVASLLLHRRKALPVTVTLAAAGLLGFAPFLLEAWIRFGLGPIERLFAARGVVAGGVEAPNVVLYLNNLEGPFRCVRACKLAYLRDPGLAMSWREALTLGGVGAFTALGTVEAWRRQHLRALALASVAVAGVFGYYLQCRCAVNLRYLQPAYALVALIAAAGLLALWQRASRWGVTWWARGGVVVLVLLFTGYQWTLADDTLDRGLRGRQRVYELSQVVNARAGDRPCAVAATIIRTQLEYYTRCVTVPLERSSNGFVQQPISRLKPNHDLAHLSRRGWLILALVEPDHLPPGSPVGSWEREDVSRRGRRYLLFEAPPDAEFRTRYAADDPAQAGVPARTVADVRRSPRLGR